MFLKVFEIPKNFFKKVLWWGAGVKPLPDKPKFEIRLNRHIFTPPPGGVFYCVNGVLLFLNKGVFPLTTEGLFGIV